MSNGGNINAVLLIPKQITADMIAAGTTVPVVDSGAGEVAWDKDESYTTGERVNYSGSMWAALKDHTNITPGTDATAWLREGPTNRMAPFDDELDTSAHADGDLTFVLRPGFVTGLGLHGIVGEHLLIEVYDKPSDGGGVVVETYDLDLWEQAMGLFELLFLPLKRRTQFYTDDLPLYPNPEIKIKITAAGGATCRVALISLGHWDTLIGAGKWGGTQYEAEAEIKPYTYRKVEEDGRTKRVRRGAANNVNCNVLIPADEGNHAMDLLHQVQWLPVMFIASGLPRYEYLNGFGDVSGSVSAAGPNHARVRLRIEGAVQEVRN